MPFRFVSISYCRSTIGRRIGQDAAGAQQRAGECPEEASDHHRGSGPGDRGEFKRALVVLCFKRERNDDEVLSGKISSLVIYLFLLNTD